MCQHFSGGAAESDHPRFPPEGCCEETGAHAAGQQPGCQGNCHRSAQVSPNSTVVVWTANTLGCGCLDPRPVSQKSEDAFLETGVLGNYCKGFNKYTRVADLSLN